MTEEETTKTADRAGEKHSLQNRGELFFGSLQWFSFFLSNTVAMPIVIGQVFQLSAVETAELMQRAFFVIGAASFLQGWLGHRYPVADGPAGVWLGVFILMGETALRQGGEPLEILRLLEGGMLLAGLLLILLALTGAVRRVAALFTPLVTGVYLILLVFQLSGVFLQGMLGVDEASRIHPLTALCSFGILALVIGISVRGSGWVKHYSVLIGILVGWALFVLLGRATPPSPSGGWFQFPEVFAWGNPELDPGMALSALLIALILLSNLVATMAAASQVLGPSRGGNRSALARGSLLNGVANGLAAFFSSVGTIPLSSSAGFMRMTGLHSKAPFLIGSTAVIGIAFLPGLASILAALPGPVAYAVLMASFVHILGIGLDHLTRHPMTERRMTISGIALIVGVGVMFVPADAFSGLPSILRFIVGNGLLIGTFTAVLLDRLWRED
ncbi:MAG: purine/pyrimidine permease [Firmicutes bacterium]|uniref:Xanthine/uracil permease n=1 Tax=Melghirimyces thermohalophilus TaxID=1236220 RepID=A0A1G6L3Z0_9BACL|nr:purine/pyrimidine permease [Melghirimyces thermohalophilus]MDA8352091.1 purine/pyrimidine permease [Bacillota bacterium]SDC37924.1 Xanthine/uracil permease [Melghirimyces thermohalophilus]